MNSGLPRSKNSSGQVLLIVLLVISVLLIVGLSVVSRSVTDIKISQQSQEAARALWVAQSGLENAIKANANIPLTSDVGLSVDYSVDKKSLEGTYFVFPGKVNANEAVTVWLIPHNDETGLIEPPNRAVDYKGPRRISLHWAEVGNKPAIEMALLYKDNSGNFQFKRETFDANASRAANETYFTPADSPGATFPTGETFAYCSRQLIFANNITPYLLRLRLIFNTTPQPLGVKSEDNQAFPKQGNCFFSTATVQESGVVRKLSECRLWQTTPPIFDYLLFSGGSIE
jgi:type II secretory pathway pseudopilin PulG